MHARMLQSMVAALLLASCAGAENGGPPAVDPGAGGDPAAPPAPTVSACLGTYSGAVTGTFECSVTALHGDAGRSSIGFDVVTLDGEALDLIVAGLAWTGELTTGTWSQTDSGVSSAYDMLAAGSASSPLTWFANKGWPSLPDEGSSSVTITAIAARPGTSPQEYDVDGTFTATLSPLGGATGDVTIDVTF